MASPVRRNAASLMRVPSGRVATLVGVAAVLAALHFGRDLLIPLSLAVLLSFALGAAVSRVEKLGLGRVWSIGLVVGILVVVLGGIGWVATTQMKRVIDELPNYRTSIQAKVGVLTSRIAAMRAASRALVPDLIAAAEATVPAPPPTRVQLPAGASSSEPLFVIPVEASPSLLQQMPAALVSLLNPVGTAGMVMLFAIFMLRNREDLRNRFLRLISNGDFAGTTHALADAWQRIGHYLGMQSLINVGFGLCVALGLFLLGVPGWALWGLLCSLLRYLPYIGPMLGAAMPIAMALAASPGWMLSLGTLLLFLVLELFVNMVVEPRLYGESVGASPSAVLVAAAVWTWLWGPIGLLLAMPLTVVVVVLGKSVPQLGFLDVLFGTDEALSPADRYYQRVMAGDPGEAIHILDEVAADHDLPELYEKIVVPGLAAAERDQTAGKLTEAQYLALCDNILDSIEAVDGRQAPVPKADAEVVAPAAASMVAPCRVVCLAAKSGAHEVAAAALCRLLQHAGQPCRTFGADLGIGERIAAIDAAEIVCIVSLPDPTLRHLRALCKGVRGRRPELKIVVLAWGASTDPTIWWYRSLRGCTDGLATNAKDLVEMLGGIQGNGAESSARAPGGLGTHLAHGRP